MSKYFNNAIIGNSNILGCLTEKGELKQFVIELLNIDEDDFDTEFINLKVKNEIVIEERDGQEWIYLYSFYSILYNYLSRLQFYM